MPELVEVTANDTTQDALTTVASLAKVHLGYLPLLGVAVIPLIFLGLSKQVWMFVAFQTIVVIILFVIGTDYGRWNWIIVAVNSLFVLAISDSNSVRPYRVPHIFLILYAVLWLLPFKVEDSGDVTSNGCCSGLCSMCFMHLL